MDTFTPQDAIEWLVKEHTCQWCGELDYERGAITAEYCCLTVKKGGYTLKEWRYWRRCGQCRRADAVGLFGKWVFPVIGNTANHDVLNDLVAVQPMALPNDNVFYMDYVGDDFIHDERRDERRRRRGHDMADAIAYARGMVYPEPPHTRVKRHFRDMFGNDTVDVEITVPKAVEHIVIDFEVNADGARVVNA